MIFLHMIGRIEGGTKTQNKSTRNENEKENSQNFQRRSQQGTAKASSFFILSPFALLLIFLTHIL